MFIQTLDRKGTIPRKGAKTRPESSQRCSFPYYPRKGAKTPVLVLIITVVHAFQLIPARGRKRTTSCCGDGVAHISTYPHKGTKTNRCWWWGSRRLYFNLSPQGDGNEECCISFVRCHPFQLILARGRKPCFDVPKIGVLLFQLIPARGRKRVADIMINHKLRFQLIPARGRKHHWISKFSNMVAAYFNLSPQGDGNGLSTIAAQTITISTYPRKGTETSDIFISLLHQCLFQLIPARGRKPFIIDNSFLDIHISTYPRKGTKKLRIKKDAEFFFCKP